MGDSIESFQPDACPLLAIEDLSKGFTLHTADRRVRGCEHISLSVLPGEFVGVTGRSGSGKSTILKCIYRTNLPESGYIVYDSEAFGPVDLATLDERRVIYLRNYEIGYVSQFLDAVPRTTAREIVRASAAEAFADEDAIEEETTRMLEHFDFPKPLWDLYPNTFSGGEKLRLNIARAMVRRPRLLLLDEPTASLDNASKVRVRDLIEQLKAGGTTMLGIFHDLEFMEGVCDREYNMQTGGFVQALEGRMQEHRSVQGSFDLHTHSVYSDGSQSVQALIAEARERGLSGIAITDHDSLRQLSSVRAEARKMGFPVIAGVEASCIDSETGRKIHILCYGLAATADESGPLELLVNETLARRTANTLWQAWTLERKGMAPCGRKASVADVVEVSRASTGVYKQHVMQALTGLGYRDGEYQCVYRRLFKNGGIAERDISYPDALTVVRAAREQGGVPVLAHPQQMDSWGAIPELVKAGLMGIEAFHPDNDAVATEEAFRLARQYGIVCTGGSDYHGRYGAPECVGSCFITPDEAGESVAQLFDQERLLA